MKNNRESLTFGDVFSATLTGAALAAAVIFVGLAKINAMDAKRAHLRQRQAPNPTAKTENKDGFPVDWLRYTMPNDGFQRLVLLNLAGLMAEYYPDAHIDITPDQVAQILNTPKATLDSLIDE